MAKVILLLLCVVCACEVNAHLSWILGEMNQLGNLFGTTPARKPVRKAPPKKITPPKKIVAPPLPQNIPAPQPQPKAPVPAVPQNIPAAPVAPAAPVQPNVPVNPSKLCDSSCSLRVQHDLNHVPDNFLSSRTLNCLDVSNNVVNSVSKRSLDTLPNLKYANFKGNSFDHNPLLDAGHAMLEVLDLSFNRPPVQNYHVQITGSFPSLKKLDYKGSPMRSFRCGGNLPQLSHLDLSNTLLQMDDFKTLPRSLQVLNLHNNQLPSLTLGNLDQLTNLLVSAVDKTINSVRLENLPKLQSLAMPSCGMSDPSKLVLKGIDSLVHADLSDNLFPSIDLRMFDDSPNLKKLNLAKNPNLTHIRPSPRVKFDEIDVSGSPVKNFDWFPPTLTKINLRENNLEDISTLCIPSEDSPNTPKCPNLVEIDLSVNRIPTIDAYTFVNVRTLKILDLSTNLIQGIHPNTFRGLDKLVRINLANNSIRDFPQMKDPASVELLRLDNNRLEVVQDYTFYYLRSLKHLYLNNNSIAIVEPNAFAGLVNLEMLDLSNNRLTALPKDWTLPLQNLQDLDLRGNKFVSMKAMGVSTRSASLLNFYTSHPTSFEELVLQNRPLNASLNYNATHIMPV